MEPLGRVDFVSLQSPSIRVDTRELDIFAEVISTILAEETMSTRDTRLNSHSIA
jgi:hypothetical protein